MFIRVRNREYINIDTLERIEAKGLADDENTTDIDHYNWELTYRGGRTELVCLMDIDHYNLVDVLSKLSQFVYPKPNQYG